MGGTVWAESFGERLRSMRKMAGLTQGQLAEALKVNPAHISHFETGKRRPSADVVRRVALYFKVSADVLLAVEDPKASRVLYSLIKSIDKYQQLWYNMNVLITQKWIK